MSTQGRGPMAAPVSHLGSKQGDGEERFRQFLRQSPRAFWSARFPSPCRERLLRLRLGHRFVGAAFEKLAEERQTAVKEGAARTRSRR